MPETSPVEIPQTAYNPGGRYFISYRSVDGSELADKFQISLRAAGLNVWRDRADLPLGDIERNLREAMTGRGRYAGSTADGRPAALAGAVLIATNEVWSSKPVRCVEAPTLLSLDEKFPEFDLAIANHVVDEHGQTSPTWAAEVYGLGPGTVDAKLIHDATTPSGREAIVRSLLVGHLQNRQARQVPESQLRVDVDTRKTLVHGEVVDPVRDEFDLTVRTHQEGGRRWPAQDALDALAFALPEIVTLAPQSEIRLSGQIHGSIALAIGAVVPPNKRVVCHHVSRYTGEREWSSSQPDPTTRRTIKPRNNQAGRGGQLVLIVMTPTEEDRHAFDALARSEDFGAVHRIELSRRAAIQPEEANALAQDIAERVTQLGRAGELHVAFVGPWPLGVLIGYHLTSVKCHLHEWDNAAIKPEYRAVFTVNPGAGDDTLRSIQPTVGGKAES